MPAGIVEDEDYELVPTRTHGSCERCQDDAQEIGVDRGADEPNHRPAARVDEAVEIEPLEPVLAAGDRALPFGCPLPTQDRLQPDPVLIERPQLDLPLGVLLPALIHPLGKLFYIAPVYRSTDLRHRFALMRPLALG